MLGGAAFLVGANQRHLLADVFVEKFCGLEQIVFVVLLDDAELVRVGERAEMHGSRIDGGGDVHELQAKRAGGKHEIADVANQRNVGVVNRDVQLGLIIQPGGLIGDRAGRFSFLELRNGFVAGRRRRKATARLAELWGFSFRFHLNRDLRSWLERHARNFLQGTPRKQDKWLNPRRSILSG